MLIYIAYLSQSSDLDKSKHRQTRFLTTDRQIADSIGFYMKNIKVTTYEHNQNPRGKRLSLDEVQHMLNCNYDSALHIYNKLQQKVVVNEFELAQFDYDLTSYLFSLLDDVKGVEGYK
jgi:hypothetical protein